MVFILLAQEQRPSLKMIGGHDCHHQGFAGRGKRYD